MPITIPLGAGFADLQFECDDAGGLHYLPNPLAPCCRANGLDAGMTLGYEDLAGLELTEWYPAHRTAGVKHPGEYETLGSVSLGLL